MGSMSNKTPDFGGYATKNDILCEDGRIIRHNAFVECDGKEVPLVWSHQHSSVMNVLGHALLQNRSDGVYVYGFFNDTEEGQHAKKSVQHGDVNSLSIFANKLKQNGENVVHGIIREVSLCLAGANEGALIDTVIAHSIGEDEEAIISFYQPLMEIEEVPESDDSLQHASEEEKKEDKMAEEAKKPEEKAEKPEEKKEDDRTVKDVLDTLNDDQKMAVAYLLDQVTNESNNKEEDEKEMKHNIFESDVEENNTLMHDGMKAIINDASSYGSMKKSYLAHAAEYGIDNIEWLFPEYKNISEGAPGFIKRTPDEWVGIVMDGVHKSPFSRIKMVFADIRGDEARAKGYAQKGKLKKEEVFGLLKRTVDPTTVYKKQKLDRDDVVDIVDFDVISYLKGEMRMMLDEELARAFLFGDGRSATDEDKISESHIIPIVSDDNFYSLKKTVTPAAGQELGDAIIDATVRALDDYEGSGNTTMFMANSTITSMLLLKDTLGHRFYKTKAELALALNVNRIVPVPAAVVPEHVYAVIVDLKDYNVGADKGGSVNMFDDFDIDFNQMKYLIETRCSGALTKPFAAIVLKDN